jgi:hypothetical protein
MVRRVYGIHTEIQPWFCPACDDLEIHQPSYFEGDVIEVTE